MILLGHAGLSYQEIHYARISTSAATLTRLPFCINQITICSQAGNAFIQSRRESSLREVKHFCELGFARKVDNEIPVTNEKQPDLDPDQRCDLVLSIFKIDIACGSMRRTCQSFRGPAPSDPYALVPTAGYRSTIGGLCEPVARRNNLVAQAERTYRSSAKVPPVEGQLRRQLCLSRMSASRFSRSRW